MTPPLRERAQEAAAALIGRCTFPAPGSPLACAVSGGADSLALLVLAVAAGCDVVAHHVDHGLREDSRKDVRVVNEVAGELGVEVVVHRVSVGAGPNLEARARSARLGVMPAGVATGHTADDQAETVLLNLLRGASTDGLAAMRSGSRHPILALRRAETRAMCAHLGLHPVEDMGGDVSLGLAPYSLLQSLEVSLSGDGFSVGGTVAAVTLERAPLLLSDGSLVGAAGAQTPVSIEDLDGGGSSEAPEPDSGVLLALGGACLGLLAHVSKRSRALN